MIGSKGLVGLLALCASAPAWADTFQQSGQSIGQICPMYVSGAQVQMSDVNGQIQLAFTTDSGDVRDLQRRASAFADALITPAENNDSMGHMGPMSLMAKGPVAMCSEMMALPPVSSQDRPQVQNQRDGARIVIQVNDPNEAMGLRARMHLLAAQLVSGSCPQSVQGLLAPSGSYMQDQRGNQDDQRGMREDWRDQRDQP